MGVSQKIAGWKKLRAFLCITLTDKPVISAISISYTFSFVSSPHVFRILQV